MDKVGDDAVADGFDADDLDESQLDGPSDREDVAASTTTDGLDGPSGLEDSASTVDDLEGQLAKLQIAMDQIQNGDLDGAEASIVALENSTRGGAEQARAGEEE